MGILKSLNKRFFKEFFKYSIVGTIGLFINLCILYFFTELLGIFYMISAVFSFIVTVTSNFILNKIWTFKENLRLKIGKKYLKFFAVALCALTINLFFLHVFTEIFKIYYMISQVMAIGGAFIINFLGNKFWTFKE